MRLLGVLLALALCSATALAGDVEIVVGQGNQLQFTPSSLTINAGDRVTWTWAPEVTLAHTVTEVTGATSCDPVAGSPISSAQQRQGTFVHTFTEPGTFFYACLVPGHCEAGMRGAITVRSAGVTTSTTTYPLGSTTSSPATTEVPTATTTEEPTASTTEEPTGTATEEPTGTAEPTPEPMGVSLTSVYDFLSTNGSFVVFTSLLSRYDDFWPLLAGFPEGTTVSSGPEEVVGRRLARRQEVEPLGNYTVLAPTDEAFSLMFDNITYARILQDPYANPFWKYVVTYHVLNGSYVLPEEVSAGDGAAHLRCVDGYSTVLVTKADEGDGYLANSAPVYDSEPVRTGNGYVYPIGKLIWPGDYFPLANGRHADIPWVLGIAAQENGAVEE